MEKNKPVKLIVAIVILSLTLAGSAGFALFNYTKALKVTEKAEAAYQEGYDKGYSDGEATAKDNVDDSYAQGYEDGQSDAESDDTSTYNKDSNDDSSNYSSGDSAKSDEGGTVYITDTGTKYHSAGCRYLDESCYSISRTKAEKEGYEPCSICNP